MSDSVFNKMKQIVLQKLEGLDSRLLYHHIPHTLDVIEQCERIAIAEGITDSKEIYLLKVAALYHDIGFLETYAGHEIIGCKLFLKDAPAYNFSEEELTKITEMIMATKVPQKPKNKLQEIICDADLDYLGRDDFAEIAEKLRQELFAFKLIIDEKEWEKIQIIFFRNHNYHTESSRKLRNPVKQINLQSLH